MSPNDSTDGRDRIDLHRVRVDSRLGSRQADTRLRWLGCSARRPDRDPSARGRCRVIDTRLTRMCGRCLSGCKGIACVLIS